MDNSNDLKVLVVDDSETNRLMLSFMLQDMGYRVDEVENGEKAVEMALEYRYLAIFMDINMPVMNGSEATEILRNLHFEAPIFACSAEDSQKKIKQFLTKGFTDFIAKPVEPEQLNHLLQKYPFQQCINEPSDDLAYLQKLKQLKQRFIDNIPVIINKIHLALKKESWTDLKRIAHKLKGSASQFDFDLVTKISRDIELAINKNKIDFALEKTEYLLTELNKIKML